MDSTISCNANLYAVTANDQRHLDKPAKKVFWGYAIASNNHASLMLWQGLVMLSGVLDKKNVLKFPNIKSDAKRKKVMLRFQSYM